MTNVSKFKSRIRKFKKEYAPTRTNPDYLPSIVALYLWLNLDRKNWKRDLRQLYGDESTAIIAEINKTIMWVEKRLLEYAFIWDKYAVMKYWQVAYNYQYNVNEANNIPSINITLANAAELPVVKEVSSDGTN